MNSFTPTTVKLIFQKFSQIVHKSGYYINDVTADYILKWFLSQSKLPHTEKALKFLIFQIYLNHTDSIELETALEAEELSDDYWDDIMLSDYDGWYGTYFSVPV